MGEIVKSVIILLAVIYAMVMGIYGAVKLTKKYCVSNMDVLLAIGFVVGALLVSVGCIFLL